MTEFTANGSDVFNWLQTADLDQAKDILIGCGIDNGEDEELLKINEIDLQSQSLKCSLHNKSTNIPFAKLRQFLVVDERDDHPLAGALEGNKSNWQKSLDQAKEELKGLGVSPASIQNADDILLIRQMLDLKQNSILPTRNEREEFHTALKKSDLLRLGSEISEHWLTLSRGANEKIEPDIYIKLAFFLRHTGRLDKAYRVTDIVDLPHSTVRISPIERSILATMRAAILIDQYEAQPNNDLLKRARGYAGLAWANAKSDETRMVYKRLEKHENQEAETASIERRKRDLKRVADPNDIKAHKPAS